jgi:hypothetical protein
MCASDPVFYSDNLPTAVQHRPAWPKHGVYDFLPPERFNHHLEHGGFVIAYDACLSEADKCKLRSIFTSYPDDDQGRLRFVMTPVAKLFSKFAIGAYEYAYFADDCFNEAAIREFIELRYDRAKESTGRDGQYKEGWQNWDNCEGTALHCSFSNCKKQYRKPCAEGTSQCGGCLDGYEEPTGDAVMSGICSETKATSVAADRRLLDGSVKTETAGVKDPYPPQHTDDGDPDGGGDALFSDCAFMLCPAGTRSATKMPECEGMCTRNECCDVKRMQSCITPVEQPPTPPRPPAAPASGNNMTFGSVVLASMIGLFVAGVLLAIVTYVLIVRLGLWRSPTPAVNKLQSTSNYNLQRTESDVA